MFASYTTATTSTATTKHSNNSNKNYNIPTTKASDSYNSTSYRDET